MKYELTHDILARKIEERVSADEKYRRKIRLFIAERFEFYQNTGELLTADGLEYIQPHIDSVNISTDEDTFVKDSVKSVEAIKAKARRRLINLLLAGGVAIALISVSLIFAINANRNLRTVNEIVEQESIKASITSARLFLEKYEFDSARHYLGVAEGYVKNEEQQVMIDSLKAESNTLEATFLQSEAFENTATDYENRDRYREAVIVMDSALLLTNLKEDIVQRLKERRDKLDGQRDTKYKLARQRRDASNQIVRTTSIPSLRQAFRDSVRLYDSLIFLYRPVEYE